MKLGDIDVVARIGLGTNRLTKTSENLTLLKSAVAAGVQMIDTAHLYTGGQSEETIGAAISPVPEGCIVATKGGFHGARSDVLREEIEQSFRRLRTDKITLYYLHRVDPQTPLEDSLAVIKEYRDRGQIQYVGISEVDVDQIERARRVLPIAAVQNHYNLSERKHDSVVDYCADEGIVFVPFYPLRGSGGGALNEIARRHRTTPQQIALAWLLRRAPIMWPIPGTLSIDHLRENLAASNVELTDAEFNSLR
jgi:aryl-alcohol dehydrogenase-like predicted oxidoreductase